MGNAQTIQYSTLNEIADDVDKILESTKEKKQVTVFVGKGTMKVNNPFAILFYETLLDIFIKQNLSKTDIRVILTILKHINKGNVLSLSQKFIAGQAKLTTAQVSISYSRLIKCGLIIEGEEASLFINPQIIIKESLRDASQSTAYKMAKRKHAHLTNY
jgi:hypothetical protein